METIPEMMKRNRNRKFVPVHKESSGLTADMEESFIRELIEDVIAKSETEDTSLLGIKSREEMLKEMNQALKSVDREYSPEETAEYDAEYGYFQEDED